MDIMSTLCFRSFKSLGRDLAKESSSSTGGLGCRDDREGIRFQKCRIVLRKRMFMLGWYHFLKGGGRSWTSALSGGLLYQGTIKWNDDLWLRILVALEGTLDSVCSGQETRVHEVVPGRTRNDSWMP